MSVYVRDTAFVLKAEPFKEQDAWVTLYGAQHGKLVGMARGVRSKTSKQRGHIQPYGKIEVMIAKGSAYDKIAVAQTCASSNALRSTLPGMAIFGSAVSLVARSSETSVANPNIFETLDALHGVLSGPLVGLLSTDRSALLLSSFILHLLDAEGYGMDFESCRTCGTALRNEPVWVSVERGGTMCRSCISRTPPAVGTGEWISPTALQTIRFVRREPFASALSLTAPRSVLREVANIVDRCATMLPRMATSSVYDFLFSALSEAWVSPHASQK